MVLIIGRELLECEQFRVKGSYSSTIARLFGLPAAVANKEPLGLEVTIKGNNFKPFKNSRRVYWNRKLVGFFVLGPLTQEWDGDKYKTKFELKQCERSDEPEETVPLYKWRHDLLALSQHYKQTDGAILAAGREIDPFANSWKTGGITGSSEGTGDSNATPGVLPISRGGTEADNAETAILNLGGIPSKTKGVPGGVAPLGTDGKVPSIYLPPSSGGGGGSAVYPLSIGLGGTGADTAPLARQALGATSMSDVNSIVGTAIANLPAPPTLTSLGGLAASLLGANDGVAPLDNTGKVAATYLPAPPTLTSLGGLAASLLGANNGVAPLGNTGRVPTANLPANVSYLNVAQTTTAIQEFNGGLFATNTTGITTVQNAGLTRSSFYFSNPSQAGGQRQSKINYASNGNIQIQILGDDATTVAYQWEFTASGNMLVPGVMRFQGYSSNPTGASFVPGGIYYNTALGRLVFSNGTNWIQLAVGANVT